ncbi:MAG: hypothetical protein KAY24_00075 [Candidatus Eisenbacteria sp.]|nr:hypothetical protein [Candidatus Eisenbacteria bacterium]
MNIVLASIFRNGGDYVNRWANQVRNLAGALPDGHELGVLIAEGDSTDNTWVQLKGFVRMFGGRLVKLEHGGLEWGSVDDVCRWRQVTNVWNALYGHLDDIEGDALIHVEADLIWKPETMRRLLRQLERVPAVSPMVWHRRPGRFYDTYGFRKDGVRFIGQSPYHPALEKWRSEVNRQTGLVKIDTAGSCLVMRMEVARKVWFDSDTWHPGPSIYEQGASLWLDTQVAVTHP